jgi:hypothetical protein
MKAKKEKKKQTVPENRMAVPMMATVKIDDRDFPPEGIASDFDAFPAECFTDLEKLSEMVQAEALDVLKEKGLTTIESTTVEVQPPSQILPPDVSSTGQAVTEGRIEPEVIALEV